LEGKAAGSILAPPSPGVTKFSAQSFHMPTWNFGIGQGRGVEIKLVSTEVLKNEIKITFSVKSAFHRDILLYGRDNHNGGVLGGSCELLYIVDDNGVIYYSLGGFVG